MGENPTIIFKLLLDQKISKTSFHTSLTTSGFYLLPYRHPAARPKCAGNDTITTHVPDCKYVQKKWSVLYSLSRLGRVKVDSRSLRMDIVGDNRTFRID